MDRRKFVRACASVGVVGSLPDCLSRAWAETSGTRRLYARARLVDTSGTPIKSARLPIGRNLIFHYPFAGTPCFLLNLGAPAPAGLRLATAERQPYEWQGGTGANRAIVAYSAICAHRLSYPTREISFISYRSEKTYGNRHERVIHCCSEHSQYDPAAGARVVAGPAPQPLATIVLDYDPASDELYAIGTLGGEMFEEFFTKFEFRLALDHGTEARAAVTDTCVVTELERYCRQQVKC